MQIYIENNISLNKAHGIIQVSLYNVLFQMSDIGFKAIILKHLQFIQSNV